MGEELLHACPSFLCGIFLFGVLIEFVKVFQIIFNHFIHGAVPGELAVRVAVMAVIFIGASVRFFSECGVIHGHAAALAELLFRFHGD